MGSGTSWNSMSSCVCLSICSGSRMLIWFSERSVVLKTADLPGPDTKVVSCRHLCQRTKRGGLPGRESGAADLVNSSLAPIFQHKARLLCKAFRLLQAGVIAQAVLPAPCFIISGCNHLHNFSPLVHEFSEAPTDSSGLYHLLVQPAHSREFPVDGQTNG